MIQTQRSVGYPKDQRMFADGVVQSVAAVTYGLGIGVKKERLR